MAPKFDFKRGEERIGFYLHFGNRTFVEVFKKGESRFEETNQINHICFETDDIDAFMANARSKGVTVTDKKLGVDHTWQCWLADPSGVKIEIFQYTPDSMQVRTGRDGLPGRLVTSCYNSGSGPPPLSRNRAGLLIEQKGSISCRSTSCRCCSRRSPGIPLGLDPLRAHPDPRRRSR